MGGLLLYVCFILNRIIGHCEKTSLVINHMHSNQYTHKMIMCLTLRTMTWREILNVYETDWCEYEVCMSLYERECIF